MSDLYADVTVDIMAEKLDRVFAYRVPESMQDTLRVGMVVMAPFGKGGRMIKGYVVRLKDKPDIDPSRIKDIAELVTDAEDEEARLVRLAFWMKERYGSTLIQALKTVIPVRKKVKAKEKKIISLILKPQEAGEKLAFYQKKNQKARARLLEALMEQPTLPGALVAEKLNITSSVIKAMEEQGVIETQVETVYRNPLKEMKREDSRVTLNDEQQSIVDHIVGEWDSVDPERARYLIHGVTGSGKTEVYMALIEHAISQGKSAIVLIPEIALTYQTVMRFYRRFGDRVSLINSRLSEGERFDQFERARRGEIDVMIGPRSALFTPFDNLGIIVIDEEQEPAYQSENSPRYHAVTVAMERARMEGARVVLGSATPSLTSYYQANHGQIQLLKMSKRAGRAEMPEAEIVDLRAELKEGNRSMLSRSLQKKMVQTLQRGEQIILFLNRRGFAGIMTCRSCGHVIKCPHCDVSLSLHKGGKMICHYCGYSEPVRKTCPECGSPFLGTFKAGTEQVEDEVKRLFPQARVLRMDQDTTKAKDGHAAILSAFAGHEADILIGTQMIVKGHDFPDVTLVGILAADLSLYVPDYRSAERTFVLLTQAAGRAGRGQKAGQVVIQTYDPDHYCIQTSALADYQSFYDQEILFRQLSGYPPSGCMTAIHISGPDEAYLNTAVNYLGQYANAAAKGSGVAILGPTDEVIAKIQDQYRKVLYLKGDNRAVMTAVRERIEKYIEINDGFNPLTITYESD